MAKVNFCKLTWNRKFKKSEFYKFWGQNISEKDRIERIFWEGIYFERFKILISVEKKKMKMKKWIPPRSLISSTEDFSKPKAKAFTHDLDLVRSRCVEFYPGHVNDNNVWVLIKLTSQRPAIKRVHGVHVALDSSRTVMESLHTLSPFRPQPPLPRFSTKVSDFMRAVGFIFLLQPCWPTISPRGVSLNVSLFST